VESAGSSRTSFEGWSCLASRIEAASVLIVWPMEVPEGIFNHSTVPIKKLRSGLLVAAAIVLPIAAVKGIELSCFTVGKPAIASVADSAEQVLSIDPH
jgi:hypothetical protein